jgi:hypothetical protein
LRDCIMFRGFTELGNDKIHDIHPFCFCFGCLDYTLFSKWRQQKRAEALSIYRDKGVYLIGTNSM